MNKSTLVLIIMVSSIIVLLPTHLLADVTVGSYRHDNTKSVMLFMEFYGTGKYGKNERELISVDFRNKNIHVIARGSNIEWNKVNRDGTRVAYLDGPSLLKVYDLNKHEIIYQQDNGEGGIRFYWTEHPDVLVGVNAKSNAWFILDLQKGNYQEVKYTGQYVWGASWLESCACVEFEVSNKPHTDHYVIRIVKDKIIRVKDKQYISQSPNRRYIVFAKESEYDDGFNEFVVINKNKGNIKSYYAANPIRYEHILWGNNVVRILISSSLLDLETGESLSPEYYIWEDKRERKRHIRVFDLAADPAGYVLRWDMDKKVFLVEDINAGGMIIKTYKKFWSDQSTQLKEPNNERKP